MTQQKIKYSDIMALGFSEEEQHDPQYFKQYGYAYCIITLKLTKLIYLDWAKETQLCEMVRLKDTKECDIARRMPIRDLQHLKEMVGFFVGEKEKPASPPPYTNVA
jgi:hypothetical protein